MDNKIQQALDRVNKTFRDNKCGLYAEYSIGDNTAYIEIVWGDWKHSHAYADYVMSNNGFKKTKETVTEDDGDDCYSSYHFYEYVG